MLVKNNGQKIIGFGSVHILPGETKMLPEGYDESHPTVAYYLLRGYLVKVDASRPPAQDVKVPDNPGVPGSDTGDPNAKTDPGGVELTDEEKAAAAKIAEIEAKIKAVGKMNLEPLRGEAFALGIEWKEEDTKAILVQKITEKLQAEIR